MYLYNTYQMHEMHIQLFRLTDSCDLALRCCISFYSLLYSIYNLAKTKFRIMQKIYFYDKTTNLNFSGKIEKKYL